MTISAGSRRLPSSFPKRLCRPAAYARVTVRDNGRGMDASIAWRFSKACWRRSPTGAAIARAPIRRRANGAATSGFRASRFRGSAFTIYLPRAQEPVAEARPAPRQ